jgi:transposase
MSLIHTCHFAGANSFEYLTQLQRHSSEVFKHPSQWMPWNYKDPLKDLAHVSNSESASSPA